jgi:lysozyme
MHMSEKARKLLARWEGVRKEVYDDVAGLPTIGVGHLLTQDELHSGTIDIDGQAVDYRRGLSDSQVLDLLAQDLVRFEKAVEELVEVSLSQNQFDALISFSFNVGTSAFGKSTLLKVLNQGQYDQVPAQLRRWVKAGGKTVDGLVNRRENEIALWNGQID